MNRALITDFEIMSPLGDSISEYSDRLFAGESGLSNLDGIYGKDFPVQAVGLIKSLEGKREPTKVALKLLTRLLKRHVDQKIDGVVFFIPQEDELTRSHQPLTIDEQIAEFRASVPAERFIPIHEACVSGLSGMTLAAQRIRAGLWRRALVVGVDLRCSPLDLLRFHAINALSRKPAPGASCPFSPERDGFVRSQGAGVFLLEEERLAKTAWGEIEGYGQSCDAWRVTEGRPDGSGARGAVEAALRISRLTPSEIDVWSAHATSTPLGDALEARLIETTFGDAASQLPIAALKSQIGHAGQASGLLQVAAALLMLKKQWLTPTLHFPEFTLSPSRQAKLRHVLCNATAFGGQNACLIVGAAT